MPIRPTVLSLSLAALLCGATPAAGAESPSARGYLCCNLHAYKDWINDINYRHDGSRLLRAGTPIATEGAGRYYFSVKAAGRPYSLGNDYSRSLDAKVFLRRYIVPSDPRAQLAGLDAQTREAIERLRVMPGMTPEQVRMAIGYPVANYTPDLGARTWQYWLDRSSRFDVHFDAGRRVSAVTGDPTVLARVVYQPGAETVKLAQTKLRELGFDAGEPDGRLGPRTRAAIEQFQRKGSLAPTRTLDAATMAALGRAQAAPPPAPAGEAAAPTAPSLPATNPAPQSPPAANPVPPSSPAAEAPVRPSPETGTVTGTDAPARPQP